MLLIDTFPAVVIANSLDCFPDNLLVVHHGSTGDLPENDDHPSLGGTFCRERERERVQLTHHGATTINKGRFVFLIAASCKVSAVARLNWLTDTQNKILQTALLTTCHLAVRILSKTGVQYGV